MRIIDDQSFEVVWQKQPFAWEAWLQDVVPVSVRSDLPEPDCVGPYRDVAESGGDVRFHLQPHYFAQQPQQPREVVEHKCENTANALRALDQRRILVFDRVAPWELAMVRGHVHVQLGAVRRAHRASAGS